MNAWRFFLCVSVLNVAVAVFGAVYAKTRSNRILASMTAAAWLFCAGAVAYRLAVQP